MIDTLEGTIRALSAMRRAAIQEARARVTRALREAHSGITRDVQAWIPLFVPGKSNALRNSLQASVATCSITPQGDDIVMVFRIGTPLSYAPDINARTGFFDTLVQQTGDTHLPNRLRQSLEAEGMA